MCSTDAYRFQEYYISFLSSMINLAKSVTIKEEVKYCIEVWIKVLFK